MFWRFSLRTLFFVTLLVAVYFGGRASLTWRYALAPSLAADALEWRTRRVDGPFGQRLFLLERLIQPAGSMESILVQLALDENELRVARDDFSLTLALFLLLQRYLVRGILSGSVKG